VFHRRNEASGMGAGLEVLSESVQEFSNGTVWGICAGSFEWHNSRGMALQHWRLWRELLRLNELINIRWQWIRGHSRHPVQTRADALAYQEAKTQWCNLRVAA
jgi:ribonuclease HI